MDVSCSFPLILHTLSWTVLKAEGGWKSSSSSGTLNSYFFFSSLGKYPMGFCQVGAWKSQSLLCCDPASCSFPSHENLQLHNSMVAATKTAFSPHPWTALPHLQGWDSEGCLFPPVPSPRGCQEVTLMHLESSWYSLYTVLLPFWQFLWQLNPTMSTP